MSSSPEWVSKLPVLGVIDLGTQVGEEHLRDALHVLGQRIAPVFDGGGVLGGCGAKYVRADVGILPGLAQQRHHRVAARHVAVHPGECLKGEHPQLFVLDVGEKAVSLQIAHRGNRDAGASQRPGQAAPEVDGGQHVLALRVDVADSAAQPALGANGVRLGGMPDVHGAEVGAVGVLVADALDNGNLPFIPQGLHRAHAGVEANIAVEGEYLFLRDMHRGAGVVILSAAVRHDCIQAVVPAGELYYNQSLFAFVASHLLNPLGICRIFLNLLCSAHSGKRAGPE